MDKRQSKVSSGSEPKMPDPMPIEWFLEPIDADVDKSLRDFIGVGAESQKIRCADGKLRPLLPVIHDEVLYAEQSRKKRPELEFSVWYKDVMGAIVLHKSNRAYKVRNASLNLCRRRRLKRFFKAGDGQSAKIPRKRTHRWRSFGF